MATDPRQKGDLSKQSLQQILRYELLLPHCNAIESQARNPQDILVSNFQNLDNLSPFINYLIWKHIFVGQRNLWHEKDEVTRFEVLPNFFLE